MLGFSLLDGARRALVPRVPGPLEKRMAPLLAERATCSVLFIGPSYVASQFLPEAFNREAERIRLNDRACRFGANGLRGYELRLSIERLLSHDWPRLRLVIIDITLGDEIDFKAQNWLNPRVVEWHTLGSWAWLLDQYEGREPLAAREKFERLVAHAKHIAAHYAEVGHGIETLRSIELLERLRPAPSAGDGASPEPTAQRRNPRESGARYERHVQAMIADRGKRGPRYGDTSWPLELRALVRDHGKEAWFLIAPVLYRPTVPARTRRGRDPLVVLDFNDPARFPELYEEDVRGNTSHLRGAGRTRYSEELARQIRRIEKRRR